jgi:hypothetical protein
MQRRTLFVFLVVVALLVVSYLYSYHQLVPGYEVIQTPLASLCTGLVLRKVPVVVSEQLADPGAVLSRVLRYSYWFAEKTRASASRRGTTARFTALWHDDQTDDAPRDVDIFNPMEDGDFVTVRLKRHQPIILPIRWRFSSETPFVALQFFDAINAVTNAVGGGLPAAAAAE